MAVLTFRDDESVKEELAKEADALGFDSTAELIRHLVRNRDIVFEERPPETDAGVVKQLEALREEIQALRASLEVDDTEDASERPEPAVESVEELDLPGQGETLAARQDALGAVYDRLQELGEAQKDELLEVVDPEAVGYQDRSSFWSNVIGGRDTLSRLPGVEPPTAGGRTWRYVGDFLEGEIE